MGRIFLPAGMAGIFAGNFVGAHTDTATGGPAHSGTGEA